jgi:hypothetical protein
MQKRLSAYERQNRVHLSLQETGTIERALFTLDWLESPGLQQRWHGASTKERPAVPWVRLSLPLIRAERGSSVQEPETYRASGFDLGSELVK